MRINEVISHLKKFMATVRIKGTSVKTLIDAESQSQARLLLSKQYGEKNVVSVSHINLDEQQTVTPIPSQVRHQRIINNLTKKVTAYANKLRPTQQDLDTAVERFNTNQKRVNLELKQKQKLAQMRRH